MLPSFLRKASYSYRPRSARIFSALDATFEPSTFTSGIELVSYLGGKDVIESSPRDPIVCDFYDSD